MLKVLWFRFQKCLGPFNTLLKEGSSDIYLTTFFGVYNFGNTSAMRVTFHLKMFKI